MWVQCSSFSSVLSEWLSVCFLICSDVYWYSTVHLSHRSARENVSSYKMWIYFSLTCAYWSQIGWLGALIFCTMIHSSAARFIQKQRIEFFLVPAWIQFAPLLTASRRWCFTGFSAVNGKFDPAPQCWTNVFLSLLLLNHTVAVWGCSCLQHRSDCPMDF